MLIDIMALNSHFQLNAYSPPHFHSNLKPSFPTLNPTLYPHSQLHTFIPNFTPHSQLTPSFPTTLSFPTSHHHSQPYTHSQP